MSGQIRMSPEELKGTAQDYGKAYETINTMLTELRGTQSNLAAQWEGRAFESFDQQFEQLSPKVEEFGQLMEEIKVQLTRTAEAMAEQDQALAQNFGLR